jgi:hypothetical protein
MRPKASKSVTVSDTQADTTSQGLPYTLDRVMAGLTNHVPSEQKERFWGVPGHLKKF